MSQENTAAALVDPRGRPAYPVTTSSRPPAVPGSARPSAALLEGNIHREFILNGTQKGAALDQVPVEGRNHGVKLMKSILITIGLGSALVLAPALALADESTTPPTPNSVKTPGNGPTVHHKHHMHHKMHKPMMHKMHKPMMKEPMEKPADAPK